MKKMLTLIELIMAVAMLAVLATVAVYIFRAVLISWSGQEVRSGIDISLDRAIEEAVRDLREAREMQSTPGYDEVRLTHDQLTYYIYYLYNADDSYVPPPNFNQDSYELRKAMLTGGINGTFTYGDGRLIASDIIPPPTSNLSTSGNMTVIDLSITRNDETIRSRTEVLPRNL